MPIKSYDPRITRLGIDLDADYFQRPVDMDQLETYEIFSEVREGKGYQHVGIIHGADVNLAFLEAKEQYGRRGKCFGIWTVKTADITISEYATMGENIFDSIREVDNSENIESYDIFIKVKRGKEPKYIGSVDASSPQAAFYEAKKTFENVNGVNLWAVKTCNILKTTEDDKVIFATAPEKKYREALIYKIKDRINAYRAENGLN